MSAYDEDPEEGEEAEGEEMGGESPPPSAESQVEELMALIADTLTDSPAVAFLLMTVDSQGKTAGAIHALPRGRSLTEAEAGSLHLALGYVQANLVSCIYDAEALPRRQN